MLFQKPKKWKTKLQKKIYFCNQEDYTLDDKTIICLDALDELPFTNLYSFFEFDAFWESKVVLEINVQILILDFELV